MNAWWAQILLYANLVSQIALFIGVVWSIAFPSRRIYPMASRDGWWFAMWILFGVTFLTNPIFVFLDWNTGFWTSPLRFWLAGPVSLAGGALVAWGVAMLGPKRTSALPEGLLAEGPYRLTRNPQYVGDFLLFVGITILANSGVVAVTHLLTALIFLLAPFAEEPWLEREYGEPYVAYRRKVPRFV